MIDGGRAADVGVGDQAEFAERGQRAVDGGAMDPGRGRLGPADDLVGGQMLVGPVQSLEHRLPGPGDPLAALPQQIERHGDARSRARRPRLVGSDPTRTFSRGRQSGRPLVANRCCDTVASAPGPRIDGGTRVDDRDLGEPARPRRHLARGRSTGMAIDHRHGRLHLVAARRSAGACWSASSPRSSTRSAKPGARHRARAHRVHARHAARVRRRPHRRDRQHHPQADGRRQAPGLGRASGSRSATRRIVFGLVALLALGVRVAGRSARERLLAPAADHRRRRHRRVRHLPV